MTRSTFFLSILIALWGCQDSSKFEDNDGDGYSYNSGDCDDSDPALNPGDLDQDGLSTCDGDCDGDDPQLNAADQDEDGVSTCDGDCNDGSAAVSPLLDEVCDGLDNDCDGVVDEGDAVDASTWYTDSDGDGFGNPSRPTRACSQPDGTVADNTDCFDSRQSVNPAADETCNGLDDDCDGETDEDSAADASTWFQDSDGDSYGNASVAVTACTAPVGFVGEGTDCSDADGGVNPAAVEACDASDNNCDGIVDEDSAVDATIWYLDGDGDGHGDPAVVRTSCAAPSGHVANGTDCNDSASSVNPAATERCDGIDNDCDAETDEPDSVDAGTFYMDVDNDGYGDPASPVVSCYAATGAAHTEIVASQPGIALNSGNAIAVDTISFAGCGAVSDVQVSTNISHVYRGDLEITLESPAGTTVVMVYSSTDSLADYVGTWADSGGDFAPDEPLSSLLGENSEGSWSLNVEDTFPSVDDGTWNSWELAVTCSLVTVADNTDCDDSDATQRPEDLDGDGYSGCDGDCDDSDPLASPADSDGDGYSGCDGDCDDGDPNLGDVSIDADCDGSLTVADCDDNDPLVSLCQASCLDILNLGQSVGDGQYTVYPDGVTAVTVYCDMANDDGGWTLVAAGSSAASEAEKASWNDESALNSSLFGQIGQTWHLSSVTINDISTEGLYRSDCGSASSDARYWTGVSNYQWSATTAAITCHSGYNQTGTDWTPSWAPSTHWGLVCWGNTITSHEYYNPISHPWYCAGRHDTDIRVWAR